MQPQEIKQLIKTRFGGMARMGRKMKSPVTGQAISLVIDRKRRSHDMREEIARMLRIPYKKLWGNN